MPLHAERNVVHRILVLCRPGPDDEGVPVLEDNCATRSAQGTDGPRGLAGGVGRHAGAFGQGAGGTNRNTNPAEVAIGLFQGNVQERGRPRFEAPVRVVDGSDHGNLPVGPDTAAATYALAQVPPDERVQVHDRVIGGDLFQAAQADSQVGGDLPELAAVPLVAHDARVRVAGQHQFHHDAPVLEDPLRSGVDDHACRNRGDTRGQEPSGGFILHEADPACAQGAQVGIVAEGGDLDADLRGQLENRHPRMTGYLGPVECNGDGFHQTSSSKQLVG